eukprot:GGOE01009425.1.p3 GENE.GGOE01009425.1~~GGOE01009425.1.p3  ORF type:complete len:106 (-),score=6.57 GGOE01009425.1:334-651(-)
MSRLAPPGDSLADDQAPIEVVHPMAPHGTPIPKLSTFLSTLAVDNVEQPLTLASQRDSTAPYKWLTERSKPCPSGMGTAVERASNAFCFPTPSLFWPIRYPSFDG